MKRRLLLLVLLVAAVSCGQKPKVYTLKGGDLTMEVTDFGGHVMTLCVPDREGKVENIVLSRPKASDYVDPTGERFIGSTVGVYANRIAGGRFTLDSVEYTLPQNNNGNTLHGGLIGIDLAYWDVVSKTDSSIHFTYTKPHLQDGFPGNVKMDITYTLTSRNEFRVDYEATTDQPTVINLSHHSFFNLKGEGEGDILNHRMRIFADGIIPVGEDLIPTGEIMPVEGTPFDFNEEKEIGRDIAQDHVQLNNGGGYDHCWVLSGSRGSKAAEVYEPQSGRVMEVFTDQPGMQFYSGNFFDSKQTGANGKPFVHRGAIALETQLFPDSPNQPSFPSSVLRPGEVYTHTCTYRFSTRPDGALSGNPISTSWYADPEAAFFEGQYWIYPTTSLPFDEQTYMDAFSSTDLVNWTIHKNVLVKADIPWLRRALWAPSVVCKDGKYYFFFGGNDVHEGEIGGIGVAVADNPAGPFKDALGKPLIGNIVNGAQPIDQFIFNDGDEWYMYYGGWGHCNIVRLSEDLLSLRPFEDGQMYKEITPEGYVEGPFMFKKDGKYYFMWSEGGWTGPDYRVAYAMSDSPFGPFKREGVILQQDDAIGRGAGHNSVMFAPDGKTYMVYHRRPLDQTDGNCRMVCVDLLEFASDGKILPVKMTECGVAANPV